MKEEIKRIEKVFAEGLGVTSSNREPVFIEDIAISLRRILVHFAAFEALAERAVEAVEQAASARASPPANQGSVPAGGANELCSILLGKEGEK